MTYDEAVKAIHCTSWKGHKPGLFRIGELLRLMGDPQDRLRYVHIAGSNGKGSTAALTASILQRAGYKTGLCISPYIHRFNERMQINGVPIADGELVEITQKALSCAEKMSETPTEFELVNGIAFEYFAKNRCDIVVLEVGLGGRLDATNIIKTPEAAVITAIGLEHTELLGDTVEKIAREKAGIIKSGGTAVISEQQQSVIDTAAQVCREKGVPLLVAPKNILRRVSQSEDGQRLIDAAGRQYFLPLLGEHQIQNLCTALTVVEVLRQKGFLIGDSAVFEGVKAVDWPGRFELMRRSPAFFLDGGHNPQCAQTVAHTLRELFGDKKVIFMLGVLSDKDQRGIIEPVLPVAERFVTITPPSPRAMSAEALSQLINEKYGVPSQPCSDIARGIETALSLAKKDGVICAYGSLYSVGAIREYFGKYER